MTQRALNQKLLLACRSGPLEDTIQLLDQGADPNCANASKETPLHLAADGYPAKCKALVERGAHLEAVDSSGRTALDWAATSGHEKSQLMLIVLGANPASARWRDHVSHRATHTPLDAAAEMGDPEVLLSVLSNDRDEATLVVRAKRVAEISDALDLPASASVVRAWLAQREARAVLAEMDTVFRGDPRP